jgi:hypothetical protein
MDQSNWNFQIRIHGWVFFWAKLVIPSVLLLGFSLIYASAGSNWQFARAEEDWGLSCFINANPSRVPITFMAGENSKNPIMILGDVDDGKYSTFVNPVQVTIEIDEQVFQWTFDPDDYFGTL